MVHRAIRERFANLRRAFTDTHKVNHDICLGHMDMPKTQREPNDVFYVDDPASTVPAKIPPTEIDGLVSGFLKIKSLKIRREVMALITELTREDRKL